MWYYGRYHSDILPFLSSEASITYVICLDMLKNLVFLQLEDEEEEEEEEEVKFSHMVVHCLME